jgi:hypothetical protein
MKNFILSLLFVASAILARGNTITIKPAVTSDLKDLDHSSAVSWGFDLAKSGLNLGTGWTITSATISIKNINDWTIESNDKLFIDLLDNPVLGTNGQKYYSDTNDLVSDYFFESAYKTPAYHLTSFSDTNEYYDKKARKWVNPSENFSYTLTGAQIAMLNSYLKTAFNSKTQWNVGLGFDADCHYYNDGVSFTVTTKCVPDAVSSLGLLGLGFMALAGLRRFVRRA